ncbi:3-dehydroquinate synthase [Sporolactobacillus pectinivorans]|uniref:3-dehydroquinate synthase n=1 Tax=Sporolactobacillus pectinivorans TaxID=1591408 RepID=UPI000C268551|nr:3-dehydroquinate synthase [Sporolactobacillus pectinivorans]
MENVQVDLPQKRYTVRIERGLLNHIGMFVSQLWTSRKIAVISDSNVAPLYERQVVKELKTAGFTVKAYPVPAGETSKTWQTAVHLYQKLAADHFTRTDSVLALGGGVVGDLAGFVASTFMRGLALIQMPTSTLAQVDSSVGGKTAIDLDMRKNMVGTFYQPDAVFIDPDMLATLPQRYVVEGYAEIVKMAALAGGSFWQMIEQINQPEDILKYGYELIYRSVAYKASVVMEDEKEKGHRQFLNFGHSIGHAIELLSDGKLAHGEAISIGMVQLTRLFENCGLSPQGITDLLTERLQAVGLPLNSVLIGTPAFIEKLKNDKKNHGNLLHLVYLKALGQPTFYPIPIDQTQSFFSKKDK